MEHLTTTTWDERMAVSRGAVLALFGAPWCPFCRGYAPIVDDLSHEIADRVETVEIDVDESPELAARFSVKGLPTLLRLEEGVETGRLIGARSREAVRVFALPDPPP